MEVQAGKAEPDHWRRKYFDAIRALEDEERQFRDLEACLRRFVNRLCFASLGLSPQLDGEIGRLTEALRRKVGLADLEGLFLPLSNAISALEGPARRPAALPDGGPAPPGPLPAEEFFGDEKIRQVLERLLGDLRRDSRLAAQVESLDARLQVSLTREQLPVVLAEIADLAAQRVANVESEKRDAETLLGQITARLDELGSYIVGGDSDQQSALESTRQLNSQLLNEMTQIGESVEAGVDVVVLKSKVRARLDAISLHIEEYRDREESRARAHWERSEQMRARVESLEKEARKLQERLKDEQLAAMIDTLTRIPNRLAYDQRLAEEHARFRRFGTSLCIAAWDIDHFKRINDAYGHRAGDKVLRIVAECLAGRIRQTDFVARYGGEEFVMILTGTTPQDALRVADSIRESVAALGLHFRGAPVALSVSCGIAVFGQGDTPEEVFDRADKALYRAKEDGRNRCYLA